jgi:hypothetical protein
MAKDPAVERAAQLWNDDHQREALKVLVQRVNELNTKPAPTNIRNDLFFGMDNATEGFQSFLAEAEIVSDAQFDLATDYFKSAHDALFRFALIPDVRMGATGTFIWGN